MNKTNLHLKSFALGLALKQKQKRKATPKSPISPYHIHMQYLNVKYSSGKSNLADRMEEAASLAKVQLCECENQTLKGFLVASRLYAKFDCPVAHQNISLLATAHDCETGLWYSLPFCLPSLIVQWPTIIFHF